jgi:hypothetical protein
MGGGRMRRIKRVYNRCLITEKSHSGIRGSIWSIGAWRGLSVMWRMSHVSSISFVAQQSRVGLHPWESIAW